MSYQLKKKLTKVNFTAMNGKKNRNIVIHYTGNQTDTASANANYFYSTNRGASAHYFVDDNFVYQVVKDKDAAWAVGKNYGNSSKNLFQIIKNSNSLSIEMCSQNGKITDKTIKNTVALTKKLMKKYKIPAGNVVRHFDVCSKICPGWDGWGTNGPDASIWKDFKKRIQIAKPITAVKPNSKKKYIQWVQYQLGLEVNGKWTNALETAVISYKKKHHFNNLNGRICGKKMIKHLSLP